MNKRYVVTTTAVPTNSVLDLPAEVNVFRSSAYDAEGAIMFAQDSIAQGYRVLGFEEV